MCLLEDISDHISVHLAYNGLIGGFFHIEKGSGPSRCTICILLCPLLVVDQPSLLLSANNSLSSVLFFHNLYIPSQTSFLVSSDDRLRNTLLRQLCNWHYTYRSLLSAALPSRFL